MCVIPYLVCRRGIGREIHKNGSKVLLCLRQWGHVREDLEKDRQRETDSNFTLSIFFCDIRPQLMHDTKIIWYSWKKHYIFFQSPQHPFFPSSILLQCSRQPIEVTDLLNIKKTATIGEEGTFNFTWLHTHCRTDGPRDSDFPTCQMLLSPSNEE